VYYVTYIPPPLIRKKALTIAIELVSVRHGYDWVKNSYI